MTRICQRCCKEYNHRPRSNYCSTECSKQITPEHREKISKGRKKYLLENKELHPWKRKDKFKSEPCERVKQFLKDSGISFVEEWTPLEDRNFSIDIAFPDTKFGIEINGNQHYNKDGSLAPYYQQRHDLIEKAGWTLLELHYSIAFNLEKLKNILDIKEQPDYSEYFKILEEKRTQRNLAKPLVEKRGGKVSRNNDIKWEPFKQIIANSDIDFSKFGWVNKVAELLSISPQKVNKWMKRYLPDIYENKCFKRKSP